MMFVAFFGKLLSWEKWMSQGRRGLRSCRRGRGDEAGTQAEVQGGGVRDIQTPPTFLVNGLKGISTGPPCLLPLAQAEKGGA